MKKFRIGYFADGPWSHLAFKKLIADETIEFAFIVPRSDTQDDTLLNYANKHQVDYLFPVRINSDEFYETARKYNCDLFVSMSFNQIYRSKIANLPPLKTINCHAGKLPFYRGRNILNWALINDEKEFGITVHYIDEGIDTGDIILQRNYTITDEDSYGSLLKIAYVECANILYDAIKQIQNGTSNRIPQSLIHQVGFYCGKRGHGDEIINWTESSRDIFNLIRSISSPGPKATTSISGSEVQINCARLIEHAPVYKNTVGQLLSKTKTGFLVKTQDSFIEISEIESNIKLRVGDKLGR
jgi:methionyl-tRNA formyltransferase